MRKEKGGRRKEKGERRQAISYRPNWVESSTVKGDQRKDTIERMKRIPEKG